MRTDEQRDYSIDLLLKRVMALEAEVARLKGEPLPDLSPPLRKSAEPVQPYGITFTAPQQKPSTRKPVDSSLENAIGTRWIGRIGILALLFGIAFFLKYSFDNRLIGESGRVILGIVWGAVFIGAGEYLQRTRNMGMYGQMLSAGGLGVLYLALYAAFALYHLIPAALATAGMLAVTSTGMTLSIRYSTYSLAALALLGGFLTPFMLSTGQNQPLTLFGYILLLDIGTLVLLRFRHWPSLVAASLFGTALLYFIWHDEYFTPDQRWEAFGIIIVFFLFYNASVVTSRLAPRHDESRADQIIIFGSAALFFLAFYVQQGCETNWPIKSCALVLAGCEIGLAELVRRVGKGTRLTTASYAAASVIMTVIATFLVLEQGWLMPALTAEMATLAWIGFHLDLPLLRRGAYLIGLLVLFRFADEIVLVSEPFQRVIPLFNGRFLVCAAAAAGFYLLMYLMSRYRDRLDADEHYAPAITFVITQALSLALLSFEVHDFFRFRTPGEFRMWDSSHYAFQLSLSVLWALYGSTLTGVGICRRLRGARVVGILLLGLTVLKVFLMDLSSLETVYRIISFIVLGLLLLAVSYGYNRFKNLIFGEDQA